MYAINHVPLISLADSTTGCCTLINPKEWDEQTFIFKNKLFAKAQTRSFMHIPLNMSSVMAKAQALIDAAGARSDEWMILSYEKSPWKAEHFFAVTKEVPGLETEELSGTYMTKVFEGPYKDAGRWYKQLQSYVQERGQKPLKTYFFYTVCPGCAQKYGKNYVIGFEQI